MKIYIHERPGFTCENFLAANVGILGFTFHKLELETDLGSALERLLKSEKKPFIVSSANAIFPTNFQLSVRSLISELNATWQDWGVVGETGVSAYLFGQRQSKSLTFSSGPGTLPTASGVVLPALQLSNGVVLVNPSALNKTVHGLIGDREDFGTILSNLAFLNSSACLLSSSLSVYFPNMSPIKNLSKVSLSDINIDLAIDLAAKKKLPPSLTIVTRTRFANLGRLERAISSVEHFKRNAARFKITHIVISDVHNPIIKELENRVKIVKVPPIRSDSRFRLIHRAIQEIESSHVLFLDDDDWLDESADCKILKAIQAYPSSTIFHFDSQYFYESGYDVTPGLVVPGTDVSSIFQFLNRIPFCSTVWPVDAIRKLPQVAFDDITLLEDLFLLLSVWSFGATPVFPQIRIAGVSVRTGENSKDLYAKSSWLTARATVAHHIASLSSFNSLAWAIVLPPKKSISLIFIASFKLIRKPSIVYHLIKTGVFPGILRGEIRPSELLAKARAFANSASLHSGKWK